MNTPEQQLSESLLAACKAAGIEEPKYIAQDKDGSIYHYNERPIAYHRLYHWDDSTTIYKRIHHPHYADDWLDSLMEWVDHIADTSKKMDDASKITYQKHLEKDDDLYWSRYRQGWLDALAWKTMAEEGAEKL